ncbi:hypothetical protein MUK60_07100 [Streptomyces sp. LRE541]|uniref:hypothetical protein n=1 Tax=Streptomyces sp. LRE541 TaxID=2931983 RepID=UPI00200E2202|nr:hypothetical protein [Streptomyces sp. LRE541]UPZ27598.1 hypothetical protein MUK60_07100 [Streptomyces sp. LRE541]
MSDESASEPRKDWMEIWYETGEITWQKPLSPEANERIQALFNKLRQDQAEQGDGES